MQEILHESVHATYRCPRTLDPRRQAAPCAVFQMKNGKTPGYDCMNIEFVKADRHEHWKVLADSMGTLPRTLFLAVEKSENRFATQKGR